MKRRGRGIACMWYPIGFTVDANPSAAVVKMNEDGTATVLTGTVETGQGSLTVLGQIAAEALGIATDDVHVVSADTDATPMDTGAIASRTTYVTGNAIWQAAENAKAILFEVAAPMLGVKPSQLEAKDRKIQVKNYPQRAVDIGDVAKRAQVGTGTPAIGSASWNPPTVAMDPETGQGKPFATYVYATQIAGSTSTTRPARSISFASLPRMTAAPRSIRCWSRARSRAAFPWASAWRCRRRCCSTPRGATSIRT